MSLWSAYLFSRYFACSDVSGRAVSFTLNRRAPALDRLLAELASYEATLVTAANPGSRWLPPAANQRRLALLERRLRRWRTRPGGSGTGRWQEPQLLVAAPPSLIAPVAKLFGQRAIVCLRRARPPRLLALARTRL